MNIRKVMLLLPALALVLWLVPFARFTSADSGSVSSRATVEVRTVNTTISIDTSAYSGGTNTCTAIESGPVVTETTLGALTSGTTITLTAPTGFKFCTPSANGTLALIEGANGGSTALRFSPSGFYVAPTLFHGRQHE